MTTTFEVQERDISREEYVELCRKSMVDTGRFAEEEFSEEYWIRELGSVDADLTTVSYFISNHIPKPENDAELLLGAAEHFDVGTIVERRLDDFFPRIVEATEVEKIRQLIQQGESKVLEFKETLSWDIRKLSKEPHIELSTLKTVAGFLNSDGGTLLIGVSDAAELVGIETDISNLYKNKDKFLLHFKNLVKSKIGESFYPYINSRFVRVDSVEIFVVECSKSTEPCFIEERDFYVRTNPATDKLEGRMQHEYIRRRFPSDAGR